MGTHPIFESDFDCLTERKTMSEVDELFDLKNSFYLGNFAHTINEANKLKLTGDSATERDVFLYRAMIAQKQFSVLNAEIKGSSPPQLVAIKAYASYLSSGDADSNLKLLDSQLQAVAPENWVSPVMCASIYMHEGSTGPQQYSHTYYYYQEPYLTLLTRRMTLNRAILVW